jgi:cysteine-rich repeat protein
MAFAESPSVIPGTTRGVSGGASFFVASAALLALTGCECSGEETAELHAVHDGGQDARPRVEARVGTGGAGTGGAPVEAGPGSRDAQYDGAGGTLSEAGVDSSDADAGPPVSVICGDAIRGLDEECDDGNTSDDDFCTTTCRVRGRLALIADNVPFPSFKRRSISRGYHPIAGNERAAALLFADSSAALRELRAVLYRPDGTRLGGDSGIAVSEDRPPIDPADAVIAALPGNTFAVAWSVLPTGTSSNRTIALRTVDGATGALGAVQTASISSNGNQEAPDAVWTGNELVVSWMDRTDPLLPQGKVRRFDANLNPMGGEEDLSTDGTEEGAPTVAAFGGSHAALWIEHDENFDYVVHVRGGGVSWTVPGIFRFAGDRFHLEALDSQHLIATWTQVDYLSDGGHDVPSLYTAVFDTNAPGPVTSVRVTGLSGALSDDPTRGHREPALTVAGTSAYLAWVSEPGVLGSIEGALVMKEMPWRASNGGLDLARAEEALARNPMMQNTAFEDAPALALIPWTTGGTLFVAWEDGQRVFGREERSPDVIAQLVPVPIVKLSAADGGSDAQ